MKTTKTAQIRQYLEDGNKITSMEAFQKFGATRLSAIIFELRHRHCLDIGSNTLECIDRFGNVNQFFEYFLVKH